MGWYIELQCDTPACQQLSDGVRGISIKAVAAEARRGGWNQINGKWRCPHCIRALRETIR